MEADRRTFLGATSSVAMAGGLVAGYGTLAVMAGRFLYPSRPRDLAWVFVTETERMKPAEVLRFQTPASQAVTISRREVKGTAEDFLALSSVCPHLGCQVHWEPQNRRFFCPCHNGIFNPDGAAVAGPPAEAGQALPQYPLKVAFFRGASLRPVPPGESKQKDVRYLDIYEDDQLDEELVASWIRQASELPGESLF